MRLLVVALLAVGTAIVFAASGLAATITTSADSYVNVSQPTKNFGSGQWLRADGSPLRTIYLTFDAQGVEQPSSVALRLYAGANHSVGLDVRPVIDTTWLESTITHDNAPPFGAVAAATGPLVAGKWVVVDVSSLVSGDGPVSFALTTTSNTATKISAREGPNAPELVSPAPDPPVSPSPFVVSRIDASTYSADSASTGQSFVGSVKVVVEAAVEELRLFGGGTISFEAGVFDLASDNLELNQIETSSSRARASM